MKDFMKKEITINLYPNHIQFPIIKDLIVFAFLLFRFYLNSITIVYYIYFLYPMLKCASKFFYSVKGNTIHIYF